MTTMAASARTRARGRVLPKGWPDFLLQLFLFALVDLAYESSRMLATGDVATAFVHARDVVSVEQTFGFFNEISVQRFALDHPHILDVANLTYFHAHFGVTTVFMFWLYLRRNNYYYFIRNIVFASMLIALAGYMLYPTAPPRMLTDLGFTDTLEKFASINHDSGAVLSLSNPFAAVPSVHTCFSLIIGLYLSALGVGAWLSRFVERGLARAFLEVELGVALIGGLSVPSNVAFHASQAFSRNIEKLLVHITADGNWKIDLNEEITKGCVITKEGEIVQAKVKETVK